MDDEKALVWVRCGGRCVICNRYLVDDRLGDVVRIGEVAHNVGRSTSEWSPRGDADLPVDQRDLADNLLLLCHDDHRVIDSGATREYFSVQDLDQLRLQHESRIRHVTGLGIDRSTVAVRMVGDLYGARVDATRQQVAEAVLADHRFPAWLPGSHRDEIDIDLRELPGEARSADRYWQAGREKIDEGVERIREGLRLDHLNHVSLFALARLPFLVYLGRRLDDAYPVEVYDRHRETDSWIWPGTEASHEFNMDVPASRETAAVILANVSGTIQAHELPPGVAGYPLVSITPTSGVPRPGLVSDRPTLAAFERAFRTVLAQLEERAKAVRELHIFAAAPISAAITMGRCINPQVHPVTHAYARANGSYIRALEINP